MIHNIEMNKITLTDKADAAFAPSCSRAWAEINLASLAHNVRYLQSLLPARCALMPVVKANAYGHGAGLIAGALNSLGIRSFCVACVSEGMELRRQNIAGKILVLGYTHPDQFPLLDQYALTQTVVDHAHALALSAYACSASRRSFISTVSPLPVHIAIDTGMHRLGTPAEKEEQIREMFALPGLQITGMYSHLAAAGGTDPASRNFTEEQLNAFYRLTARLAKRPDQHTISCTSSQAALPGVKLHLQASYG
ncbi:MAG: alanine racemase, partial [Acetatifactor sp.]|nr:alanine racemase [Acetatifactor sp.]